MHFYRSKAQCAAAAAVSASFCFTWPLARYFGPLVLLLLLPVCSLVCLFAVAVLFCFLPKHISGGQKLLLLLMSASYAFSLFLVQYVPALQSPNGLLIIIGALAKTKEIEEEGTGFLL